MNTPLLTKKTTTLSYRQERRNTTHSHPRRHLETPGSRGSEFGKRETPTKDITNFTHKTGDLRGSHFSGKHPGADVGLYLRLISLLQWKWSDSENPARADGAEVRDVLGQRDQSSIGGPSWSQS